MPTYNLVEGSVQHRFYKSRAQIQGFGGAYANGKTTALAIKALHVARDYPGADILLARETYPKLNDTLRKVFLKWCPPDWIKRLPTQDDNTCVLLNGSNIQFRYIAQRGKQREDGQTTSNLLSATYDFIGIDQMEDPGITEKDFDDLIGRLRGVTPYRPADEDEDETMPAVGPGWFVFTLNPTANWVYRKIIRPYHIWRDYGQRTEGLIVDPVTHEPLMELYESDTYANRANLPEKYLKLLEARYRGQQRDRYLLGKWVAFEGLVYPEFSVERHLVTREQALSHLSDCLRRHVRIQVIEGYDFGLSAPTCYMLGFVDDYGRVIILDGFYQAECPYTQHPKLIAQIRNRYLGSLAPTAPVIADPAIFRRSVVAGQKVVAEKLSDLLRNLGLHTRPGQNDVTTGVAKVTAYINGRHDVPHFVSGNTPGPLLYVVDDLQFFQDEIFAYYWKRNPQGTIVDEPIGDNDHAMDTLRYMLSRLPDPSKIVIPQDALPPQWMMWHEIDSQHV